MASIDTFSVMGYFANILKSGLMSFFGCCPLLGLWICVLLCFKSSSLSTKFIFYIVVLIPSGYISFTK